jgi:hypothetical protein
MAAKALTQPAIIPEIDRQAFPEPARRIEIVSGIGKRFVPLVVAALLCVGTFAGPATAAPTVREYWIADPEAQSVTVLRRPRPDAGLTDVTVLTLAEGDVLRSPLFPGLRIPLREIFGGR